jgi:hypothetical protein
MAADFRLDRGPLGDPALELLRLRQRREDELGRRVDLDLRTCLSRRRRGEIAPRRDRTALQVVGEVLVN